MMKGIKISTKITLLVIIISLVAVAAISFFTYEYNLQANRDKITNNLNVITETRATQINSFFDKVAYALTVLQNSSEVTSGGASAPPPADDFGAMLDMGGEVPADSASEESGGSSLEDYLNSQKDLFGFQQIYITSLTGAISASTDSELKSGNFTDPDGTSFEHGSKGLHFSSVFKNKAGYYLFAIAPAGTDKLVIAKIGLTDLYKFLQDYRGLGQTGEIILARQDPLSKKILIASPLRQEPGAALKPPFEAGNPIVSGIAKALEGKDGYGIGTDYSNNTTLQVWRKL